MALVCLDINSPCSALSPREKFLFPLRSSQDSRGNLSQFARAAPALLPGRYPADVEGAEAA